MSTRSLALAALTSCLCAPTLAAAQGVTSDRGRFRPGDAVEIVAKDGVAAIPPGEDGARAALDASPRHHEWVDVSVPGADAKIASFVVYPERRGQAPVVIVIHEIYGLTEWIRAVADQLAADGFLAVAPDLLSGTGPNGGGTGSFPDRDAVVKAVHALSGADVVTRLEAVSAWAQSQPSATTNIGTVGFCWGGEQSFRYAAAQPKLGAAVVFYGTPPDPATLSDVHAAVLGLYGGDDARVTSTVQGTAEAMAKLGKVYRPHVYAGAGHGFLRAQTGRDGANRRAAEQAWPVTIEHLKEALE